MAAPVHFGSRAKTERAAADGNAGAVREQEWRAADAVDRRGAEQAASVRTRRALLLIVPAALLAALLPAIFPLTPGFSAADRSAAVLAAAVTAAGAVGIVALADRLARGLPRAGAGESLVVAAALFSAGAPAIHLAVAKVHFDEYTLFGVFFVGSGIAQLVWPIWVLLRRWRPLFLLAAVGNAGDRCAVGGRSHLGLAAGADTVEARSGRLRRQRHRRVRTPAGRDVCRPLRRRTTSESRSRGRARADTRRHGTDCVESVVGARHRLLSPDPNPVRKEETMRKKVATLTVGLSLAVMGATPTLADVSTTQTLPVKACNSGTMNAHNNIPETTGKGTTTPAHMAVPGARSASAARVSSHGSSEAPRAHSSSSHRFSWSSARSAVRGSSPCSQPRARPSST